MIALVLLTCAVGAGYVLVGGLVATWAVQEGTWGIAAAASLVSLATTLGLVMLLAEGGL